MVSERKRTAYHEAGHVLAAMCWSAGIEYVSIRANRRFLGHVQRRDSVLNEIVGSPSLQRVAELREARVKLAGFAAEEILDGVRPEAIRRTLDDGFVGWADVNAEHDLAHAVDHVGRAYPRSRRRLAHLRQHYGVVLRYLRAHRPALDALASELLRRGKLVRDEINVIACSAQRIEVGPWTTRGMSTSVAATAIASVSRRVNETNVSSTRLPQPSGQMTHVSSPRVVDPLWSPS